MNPLLEKLIELLRELWGRAVPWAIRGDDQLGLIRRFGVTSRVMRPGFNWKLPFLEESKTVTATLESTVLRQQSLTTRDGDSVSLRVVITYHIVDPVRWIIGVEDGETVMNDVGCLAAAGLVRKLSTHEVLRGPGFRKKLAYAVRARAKRWGVVIDAVGLADRTQATTFRLMGDK